MTWSGNKAPQQSTDDGQALAFWMEDELERFANDQNENLQAIDLRPTYNAPVRPRAGVIAYADGVKWNPGNGEGVYVYGADGKWHALALGSQPFCQVFLNTPQSLGVGATATRVKILVDTVPTGGDPNSWFDAVNHRILPTIPGWYEVKGNLDLVPTVSASLLLAILRKNGADEAFGSMITLAGQTEAISQSSKLVHFNGTTDYVEVFGYAVFGAGNITVIPNPGASYLSAVLVKAD